LKLFCLIQLLYCEATPFTGSLSAGSEATLVKGEPELSFFGAQSALKTKNKFVLKLTKESEMNSDQLKGKWKQIKGSAREHWGKLTDDDIEVIGGKRDQLIGKIQERYGIAREEAQKQVDDWTAAESQEAEFEERRRAS
jgi:uncharacterized protein YjbJ (UPF0337 family)